MRVKLLTLSFASSLGGFDDRPLAEFVRDKDVIAVKDHFFVVHELPYLSCLITYQEARAATAPARASEAATIPSSSSRSAPSYLSPSPNLADEIAPADRPLFASLREWRNAQARKDGVPPYVILTNRELVRVVQARPATLAALAAIAGVGPGKVERYGHPLLEQLNGAGAIAPVAVASVAVASVTETEELHTSVGESR